MNEASTQYSPTLFKQGSHTIAKLCLALILVLFASLAISAVTAQPAHAATKKWVYYLETGNHLMLGGSHTYKNTNLNSSTYIIHPSGDRSGSTDRQAINRAMGKTSTMGQSWDHRNKKITIKLQKGKTYYIDLTIKLYDNVTFIANGATIRQVTNGKGVFINALYKDSSDNVGSKKSLGGYNRCKNITISGGTYITTGKRGKTTRKKNGWYYGYSTFLFMHGKNIHINNCTIYNNYNGHYIEFAGVYNSAIRNCTFKGTYTGDAGNEVIQLDATKTSSCSPQGKPWDDTTCKKIRVDKCKFYVPTCPKGVGTNSMTAKSYYRIKITNNVFQVKRTAIAFYKVSKGSATGNTFKKGKVYLTKGSNVTLGKTEKKHKS